MNFREWLKKKILGTQGLAQSQQNPNDLRSTFLNDNYSAQKLKIKEYNVWYGGDSDEILNFYTRTNMIDYNTEPYYDRNKQSYFWAVSSTEGDVKRTHSGQPRNIVDTLVNIVGLPQIKITTKGEEKVNDNLQKILKDNRFNRMFLQEQLPLTLVEGWGCWKVNWDIDLRNTPILLYYRADACEMIYTCGVLQAIIFKDYYADEKGAKYVLIETRRSAAETLDGRKVKSLFIEKELFCLGESEDTLTPVALSSLPQLKDVTPGIVIHDYDGFLATPCIIFEDNETENTGRSIFTGKIDLFDDLDQCLSQSSNTVRRSTAREYFNSNYLERDSETGMPIMPTAFDRKYVVFQGGRDANGNMGLNEPVQTTQPAVNFQQYDAEAQHILLEIISGIMSPATLGIDIAKKDNAEAQREKEKVTIFTRNTIIYEESEIIAKICQELLCANELMHDGKVTARDYEVSVKFDAFADASFESKAEVLLTLLNAGAMTPELFIDKLYSDQLSKEDKEKQVAFMAQQNQAQQQMMQMQMQAQQQSAMPPELAAAAGAAMGGLNNNPYDTEQMGPKALAAAIASGAAGQK